ncbi:MAG: GNAT family N-acetyltransferase [Bdellovibrionia bacterium]
MDFYCRALQVADFSEFYSMMQEFTRFEGIHHLLLPKSDLQEKLLGPLAKAKGVLLCEQQTGQIAGLLLMSVVDYNVCYHRRPALYLEEIYIKPELRGYSLGKKLMQVASQYALEQGCDRLEGVVIRGNLLAQGFHKKMGAQTLGYFDPIQYDLEAIEKMLAPHESPPIEITVL